MGAKGKSKYEGLITVGQRFSKWTVISNKIHMDNEAKILCRCDCGTERYVSAFSLKTQVSTACTICSHTKTGTDNKTWKGYGEIPRKFILKLNDPNDAEKLLELWRHQKGICALSGRPISFKDNTASIDRIDSSKGYVLGNMQWVHKNVNICKNAFPLEYFLTICHDVANKNPNPMVMETEFVFGNKVTESET